MRAALAAGAPRRQQPAVGQAGHRQPGPRGGDAGRDTRRPAEADADIRAYVADRFDQIELPARWLGQRERDRALKMVDKLMVWLNANPREQIAIERAFDITLPAAGRWPRPSGRCGCGGGSTGSSATSRAASSWSTSRPAPALRARTTRW